MDITVPYPDQSGRLQFQHEFRDRMEVVLLCLGAVALGDGWNFRDLASPFWRIYLNKRDGARIRTAQGSLHLAGGRLYLIPAWVSYATIPAKGVEHIYAHFDLRGPPAPVIRALFPRPLPMADRPDRAGRLAQVGDLLAQGRHPDPAMLLTVRALVDDCLAEAVATLSERQRTDLSALALHAGPLGRVLAHIEADPAADCSSGVLARLAGCSSDHLGRLFRRHLGQPPARFVCERRIAAAARALAFGAEDLDAIALAHGFANRFSFTRAFTRQLGVSPARWRRTRA